MRSRRTRMPRGLLILAALLWACPVHAENDAAARAWGLSIVTHVNTFKSYPQGRNGPAGTVMIKFVVDPSGKLLDSRITRSSCIDELDQEALATVRRAAPFPASPPGLTRQQSFTLPFIYRTIWGETQENSSCQTS